jgi:hypothetical protein
VVQHQQIQPTKEPTEQILYLALLLLLAVVAVDLKAMQTVLMEVLAGVGVALEQEALVILLPLHLHQTQMQIKEKMAETEALMGLHTQQVAVAVVHLLWGQRQQQVMGVMEEMERHPPYRALL